MVINLLSNAVKFTQEQGEINITLKETDDKVILEIKDTGIGLTIVRNILNLHKAIIEFKSEEGKGSVISIYFNRLQLKYPSSN